MTRHILLTGATGFVGRHVLKSLLVRDVNLSLISLEGEEKKIPSSSKIKVVHSTADLFSESPDWWREKCIGIDTVIHLAWYVKPGKYLVSNKNLDCLMGTLTMAKACVHSDVKKFVGVGTCFEYDVSNGYLSVNTPLLPTTPYAAAKTSVYLMLSQYFKTVGVDFAWCRLFYLYGEGEDERRFVPYLHTRLKAGEPAELTEGKQRRDFMDVEDAGRDIVKAALGREKGPLNICSGNGITIRELAIQIADEYGRRDLLRFGARPENLVDPPCVVGIK